MELLFAQIFGNNRILMGIVATIITGLATGVGGIPVLFTTDISERFLDALLGFAAGAMLYVVSDEIIPETHSRGFELAGTWGG